MIDKNVRVDYSDYSNGNTIIEKGEFELLDDVIFTLKFDATNNCAMMCMRDKISDNVELSGSLDCDRLNTLIKLASQIRNQIKENMRTGIGGVDNNVSENS